MLGSERGGWFWEEKYVGYLISIIRKICWESLIHFRHFLLYYINLIVCGELELQKNSKENNKKWGIFLNTHLDF